VNPEECKLGSDWITSSVYMWIDIRSYRDSNGDGIGDIQGLISKLDYLEEIGVRVILTTALHPTDFAYAGTMMTKFCDIDPRLGTLEDFDRLIVEAHRRGIRFVACWAPYSTHPDHPYFQASRNPNHPKHEEYCDYYVWTDDPNTHWFRGLGHWELDDMRKQYYHVIWQTQKKTDARWCPETNPYSERMRKENERVIRFWLERGLDGFWIDCGGGGGTFRTEEDRVAFSQEINRIIHSYPNKLSIAEGGGLRIERTIYRLGYDQFWCHQGMRVPVIQTIFGGRTLVDGPHPGREDHGIHDVLIGFYNVPKGNQCCTLGWELWLSPSHKEPLDLRDPLNVVRVKQLFALATTLPLAPIFFMGMECGFRTDVSIDPPETYFVPMMWVSEEPNFGFTTGKPFIKANPYNYPENMAVKDQLADEDSILNSFKKLVNLRKDNPALQANEPIGDSYARIPSQDDLKYYAFVRSCTKTGQKVLVIFNLQDSAEKISLNFERTRHKVYGKFTMIDLCDGEPVAPLSSNIYSLQLPAHGFRILEMKSA